MDRRDRAGGEKWSEMGRDWGRPESIPQQIPDRKEQPETLLVDHRNRPILVRQPRPFGFRVR